MKKIYTFAILFLMGLSAWAQTEKTQFQTWYGDNMGAADEGTATKRIEYFYDSNDRLSRRIQTGLMENGTDWLLTNYYLYHYNEQGQLTLTNSMQYGIYDQNAYALRATNDTIDYSYTADGLLAEEYNHATKAKNIYGYDGEGRIVKKEVWKNGKLSQTLTYSDFCQGGAQTIKSESTSSYNCYDGKVTYDAEGNKISELHYTTDGVLNAAEYWTYTDGHLTRYEKKGISNGQEVDSQKTEYTEVDAHTTRATSYTYSNGEWKMKGGSTQETTTAQFDASTATTLLSASGDSETSTVVLSIQVPATLGDATLLIYRDGLMVGETPATSGTLSYTDNGVANGQHEYMVQTVIADQHQCVSNTLTTDLHRTFPRATGLHATTARKTTEGSILVTLAWNAPEVTEDMKFEHTNIIKVGTYYDSPMLDDEEVITDPTVNQVEVNFGIDAIQTLYLQMRFEEGVSTTDPITVDASKYLGKVSEDSRKLRTIETWGDAQGNDMGVTKKEVHYYGPDNRIQRIARYSKTLGADANDPASWTIYEYNVMEYGESGMLDKEYTMQYGRYDHGEMGYRATNDTTYYEYNVEGQVTRKSNHMGYTDYTYGTDGSLVREYNIEYATNNLEHEIIYSDFAGKDRPRLTTHQGSLSSYNYILETDYDEAGNKTEERKSNWKSASNSYVGSTLQEFHYDDNGQLESDTVFNIKIVNGVETYTYKSYTTYTAEEGNANRIHIYKRVWDSILKKFGNPKTWNVEEYTEINGEKYAPTLTYDYPDGLRQDMYLTVTVPEGQATAMTAFNVYRDGIEIAHALPYYGDNYTTDEYGLNGSWVYHDANVPNGHHDYFVEYAVLNNTMTDVAACRNISNVIDIDFQTELPAPTNLRETSRRSTSSENTEEGTTELNVFVTLQWDEPANDLPYDILRYDVMLAGSQVAENYDDADKSGTTYELALRGLDSLYVHVDAVYAIGRASSEAILVTEAGTPDAINKLMLQLPNGQTYRVDGSRATRSAKGIVIEDRKKYIQNK